MEFEDIKVERSGATPNSFMITEDVIGSVHPGRKYKATINGLIETNAKSTIKNTNLDVVEPKYISIDGEWLPEGNDIPSNANLLGGFGTLKIKDRVLNIPENLATYENLAYYGAKLVKLDDIFEFETEAELPVTIMNIGSAYVEEYLKIESLGGGAYIEYHDRPHFHLPIDAEAEGQMIIGHQKDGEYRLSAYKIPFGYGIYTPPHLLHADAFLVGRYIVVYSVTENFSTVILKSKNNELVDLRIVN